MKYQKKSQKDHENIIESTARKSSNAAFSCFPRFPIGPILYPVLAGPLGLAPVVQRAGASTQIRLEWNACNGTGFSWLTLNRSAGPRLTLVAVLLTILLCYDFYTHKSLFSAALRHKKGQTDSQNWLFTCAVLI